MIHVKRFAFNQEATAETEDYVKGQDKSFSKKFIDM